MAFGNGSRSAGNYSMAFGSQANSPGANAMAFGVNTVAQGWHSFVFGSSSLSSGTESSSFGYLDTITAEGGHILGDSCRVNGKYGLAFGANLTSSGRYSLSVGKGNYALSDNEVVLGRYGDTATGYSPGFNYADRLFVLANGSSPGSRSSCLRIFKSGRTEFDLTGTTTNIIIDTFTAGSTEPAIYPQAANWGYLGTGNRYFYRTYTSEIYRTNEFALSDRRVKKNIQALSGALAQIQRLQGVRYEIDTAKHPFYKGRKEIKGDTQMGFIAQELKKVFPEMVKYDASLGYYVVKNYEQLLPVLVEALKEQQTQIASMKKQQEKTDKKLDAILQSLNHDKK